MSEDYSYDDDTFKSKINDLTKVTNDTAKKLGEKEKCIPTLLIVAVIVPFVIWALFYFIKPSFVQKKNPNGSYERDNKKVFMWGFVVTLVVWVCLYLWTYCQGYDKNAFLCKRK